MFMITWSASSHGLQWHAHRVHLSSSSCSPALLQSETRSSRDRSPLAHLSSMSRRFTHLSISSSCKGTLAKSSSKPSWNSMALIRTLCLPGVVQLVRLDGRMMLLQWWSQSPVLAFPMLMKVFLSYVCVQQQSQKVNKMVWNLKELSTPACASVAVAS